MEINPIKSEHDDWQTMKEIDALMEAETNDDVGDRLDVLATLAEAWEEKANPVNVLGPIEAIRHAMELHGMRARDLEPYIGSRAVLGAVLRGERPLTPAMIQRLHKGLGISVAVLNRKE
jgi:HTH-type transcriptional regulator / antitoxin HigA